VSGGNVPWPPVESTRTDDSVRPSGCTNHWAAANSNAAIPPMCQKVVATFNRLYPGMSVVELFERGKVRFRDLKVGQEGTCVNFGLFGRCPGCQDRHEVATVATCRQAAIVKVMESALATMKAVAGA
jgi:hypothetical protein